MSDHGILVSFQELRILLYEMGVRELEGVFMPEHKYTDCEVLEVLHGMVKSNFIHVEDEEFVLREDLQRIVEIMSHPVHTFVMDPYFCYVVDGYVVVCERYWKKKEMLRIQTFSTEEFEDWKREIRVESLSNDVID